MSNVFTRKQLGATRNTGFSAGYFDRVLWLFLRVFYSRLRGANPWYVLATVFFPQKILRINGRVSWPVDFRSRVHYPERVTLGARSFPGWSPGCYIQGRNGIRVGSNLRLGPNVGLISANHDPSDYDKWPHTSPISIGDDVWIGMNAVVLPGVNIGSNCVVGANSVVTKDIPPNCIASGNPCKVIKEKPPYTGVRFSE
jgi:acetyltransferase-like isoleucine patch superfamily enzyme